jgi:hypothetical protein
MTALATALSSGAAYISIDTDPYNYPDGEIRGTLQATSSLERLVGTDSRARLLGPNSFRCSNLSDKCVVPVYAGPNPTSAVFCDARTDFAEIMVPDRTNKIRVIWLLVNGTLGDQAAYRFAPGAGIVIGPTADGKTAHNPAMDFNGPDYDNQDIRRYKWTSVHKRVDIAFTYQINVERYDPVKDRWIPCTQVDPTISNRN